MIAIIIGVAGITISVIGLIASQRPMYRLSRKFF